MKTKALPVSTPIERTPWASLEKEDQLWVLCTIREAMDMRFKEVLKQKAYKAFCLSISAGVEFSPEIVWKTLHPRAQDHFNHCRQHHEEIDDQIEYLESLIEEEDAADDAFDGDDLLEELAEEPEEQGEDYGPQ